MKIYSYVLIALVILATSGPTLALAQNENIGDHESMIILEVLSLTLYVIISAILVVVGYWVWRASILRKKSMKRSA